MTRVEWIGFVGSLVLVAPVVRHLFKNLLTDINKDLKARNRSASRSDSDPKLSSIEVYAEAFLGRAKFLLHFVLPFVLFFAFWAVLTEWVEALLE